MHVDGPASVSGLFTIRDVHVESAELQAMPLVQLSPSKTNEVKDKYVPNKINIPTTCGNGNKQQNYFKLTGTGDNASKTGTVPVKQGPLAPMSGCHPLQSVVTANFGEEANMLGHAVFEQSLEDPSF